MKKSDIRRIIKEEVIHLIKEQYLTEAFADPKLAMINKLGGLDRRWRGTFWDAAAKTYDLAWDKLPKGTLQKKSPASPEILKDITHIVGIQPDHPDRNTNVDDLLTYSVKNKYDDLVTVNSDGTRNGGVRITKFGFVKHGVMSRRVGSHLDDCTNIHSEDDLKQAEINIKSKK